MVRKRMTYTDVEHRVSNRFPSAFLEEEEIQAKHHLTRSGSSYTNYFVPRPMNEAHLREAASRDRKDSSSSNQKRATLKKKRTFSDASMKQRPVPSRAPSSPSEEPVAGPSRLQTIPTFTSVISAPQPTSEFAYSASQPSYPDNLAEDGGLAFLGRSHSGSSHHYHPLSPSSTMRSRPKTPATVSTKIDEEEYLDLADIVYTTPIPPLPVMTPVRESGSGFGEVSTLATSRSSQIVYGNGQDHGDYAGPFTPTVVDSGYGASTPLAARDIVSDRQSMKSNETINAYSSRRIGSHQSLDTIDDWVEYVPETQSLRTIVRRPTLHNHSTSEFSKFSEIQAIELADYPLSDCSTPTAVGMPSASTTWRFSHLTPPRSSTLFGSQGAQSRLSGATGGTEGTWRTLVSPKAFSKSKGKAAVRKGRPSLAILADADPKLSSRTSSYQPSLHPSPAPSCHSIILDTPPPHSSTRGSIFETPFSDLDYDYGLAVDVLVIGAADSPFNEDIYQEPIYPVPEAQSLMRYLLDCSYSMEVLPPPTDPEKTSLTTFDTEIIFKRPPHRTPSLSSVVSQLDRRRQRSSRNDTNDFPPIPVYPSVGISSNPRLEAAKQRRSFFSHVSHLFARG